MQEESAKKQEESVQRQEAMRRGECSQHTVRAIETVTITFRSVPSERKRNAVPRTKNRKLNGLRARRREATERTADCPNLS